MIAITRAVSASLGRCELTHLPRERMDVELARRQHGAYEKTLRELGVEVVRAQEEPEMPDAVFVEDMAVVLPEGAVMTRPGAESRRGEVAGVAKILIQYGWLQFIEKEGTLDGGDVLRVGKTIFVGQTARTNGSGIEQLGKITGVWGYKVVPVEVSGCLHLKSAVTQIGERLLLINPAWVSKTSFPGFDFLEVDPSESYAGNALLVGGALLYPSQFPLTAARMKRRGLKVMELDNSELAKAEGAMTCCSILVGEE